MRTIDLIEKKKRGGELTADELTFLICGYTAGEIPDYQMSAFAMAVWFNSMTPAETAALTDAMAKSGDMVDLSRFGDLSVDKHSTGGVGDKTTLIVAPLAASLGCKVAKMSGRGLGHTGGTVDKLESIPGYRTVLSPEKFMAQVEKIGVAVIGQSGNLAPADKKLYALRDVTATVDCVPLIASSIMSKKLAAGSHSIVLDVKIGSGAFMKTKEDASRLAREMVDIGVACGRKITAVLTDMDIPLGHNIGNSLEVTEAMEVLRGGGPADLREVSLALASEMVSLTWQISPEEARRRAEAALADGSAFAKAKEWIAAQGGDTSVIEDPARFPAAPVAYEVKADCEGFIARMDTEAIGTAAMLLGAGRATKEDNIDPAAGIRLVKKTGDAVKKGDVLAVLYTADRAKIPGAEAKFASALTVTTDAPLTRALVEEIIRG
ncbi:MAG: pyrimidine-nucleoside phosphorylase [Ruminococcaceae bacterium]|nr:pyrimidine-nucleoside phosphorylase [Oscillospiraceae bacterium]